MIVEGIEDFRLQFIESRFSILNTKVLNPANDWPRIGVSVRHLTVVVPRTAVDDNTASHVDVVSKGLIVSGPEYQSTVVSDVGVSNEDIVVATTSSDPQVVVKLTACDSEFIVATTGRNRRVTRTGEDTDVDLIDVHFAKSHLIVTTTGCNGQTSHEQLAQSNNVITCPAADPEVSRGFSVKDTDKVITTTAANVDCADDVNIVNGDNIITLAQAYAEVTVDKTPWQDELILAIDGCACLLYTSPSPRDQRGSRMPSSA